MTADMPAPRSAGAATGQAPLQVLVVDDSGAIRAFMTARLSALAVAEGLALQVATAPSGEAAVDCCDGQAFDLVFMDVVMPGIGGLEACRRIKARHALPVAMVSSLRAPEDLAAARDAGCDRYLAKPVKDAELQEVVHLAAQRRQGGR
ncbi:MAG TPA: response regulator [Moraxellaceae bacterium]|nr:response regulator [Moraxellaceae bacterium]